jgi:translation initiation factor IF-2
MGQLVIEVPQNINLKISVTSVKVADEILRLIKSPKNKKPETITLNLPEDLKDVDASEAVGIWADREESAEEIARQIRESNRRLT